MSKYTEAQAKAVKKYLSSIGESKIRAPKEDMNRYQEYAQSIGISFNKFAITAIEEKIERDKDTI